MTHVNHCTRERVYDATRHTISGVASMESNRSYFMRRAAQERSAATKAADEPARKAHLEMAERYRERVNSEDEPA